jgi:CRISPR system Cascade subunit CasE
MDVARNRQDERAPLWIAEALLDDEQIPVQRDLADVHRLHQRVMAVVSPASGERVLYRPDIEPTGTVTITIQSQSRPDPSHWPESYLLDWRAAPAEEGLARLLQADAHLRFRLRANPTMRIDKRRDDPLAGKRVSIRDSEEQLAWLRRKLDETGAELVMASITYGGVQRGVREDGNVRYEVVRFDGALRVVDPRMLEAAVRAGIGVGKGYGLGLLSLGQLR